jgi:tetratricopeptide (TPR) repeat protein
MKTIKTITSLLALFVFTSVMFAQETGPAIASKYPAIEARVKKSNEHIVDPKKNVKAKTYFKRAELMLEVADLHGLLSPGTQKMQVDLFLGQPQSGEAYQKDGVNYEKFTYDRVEATFANGALQSYIETAKFVEDPLKEAKEALAKTEELDVEDKMAEKVKELYDNLKRLLQGSAVNEIKDEDYADALDRLEDYIEISEKPFYGGALDTTIYYFAAYSSYLEKDFNKAIKYGNVVREANYDEPYNYFILTKSYYAQNDSTAGVEVLKDGFQHYADNQFIINELINYYLVRDNAEEALSYIAIAKKGDPSNSSYLFAEGTLFDKLGDMDNAIKSYEGAIALDPEFFNAYFNLSVLYFNHAVKLYNESAEVSDEEYQTKGKALEKEAKSFVELAVPPMEKAAELAPEDNTVLENLKTYYYRLRNENDDYMHKWEAVKAKLDI